MPRRGQAFPQKAREQIQIDQLLRILYEHAIGQIDMTATQIAATNILLKKVLPDLTSTDLEVSGVDGAAIEYSDTERAARVAALLDAARTRGIRFPAIEGSLGSPAGSTDPGDELES
jgi:hypothetical protein